MESKFNNRKIVLSVEKINSQKAYILFFFLVSLMSLQGVAQEDWVSGNGGIYYHAPQANGVGIGDFTNNERIDFSLHLKGRALFDNGTLSAGIFIKSQGTENWFIGRGSAAPNKLKFTYGNGGPGFFLTETGNLGIGLDNPLEKLEVSGNLKVTGSFIGDGDQITKLNAAELIGEMPIDVFPAGFGMWTKIGSELSYMGNVGIGIADPTRKLDVGGKVKSDGVILNGSQADMTLEYNNSGTKIRFNHPDNGNLMLLDNSGNLEATGNIRTLGVFKGNGSEITNIPLSAITGLDFGTAAGDVVQLDGTGKLPAVDGSQLTNLTSSSVWTGTSDISYIGGKVGIGTSTPARPFHLESASAMMRIDRNHASGHDPGILLVNKQTEAAGGAVQASWIVSAGVNGFSIGDYGTSVGGSNVTKVLQVDKNTHNIGIGTDNGVPATEKLEVNGKVKSDGVVVKGSLGNVTYGYNNVGNKVRFTHDSNGTLMLLGNSGDLEAYGDIETRGIFKGDGSQITNIKAENIDGLTSGSSVWTGTTDISYMGGNVGIGVSSPLEKLEVAGTVKSERLSTGFLYFGDDYTDNYMYYDDGNDRLGYSNMDVNFFNGNVSIGYTAGQVASEMLEVAGDIVADSVKAQYVLISDPNDPSATNGLIFGEAYDSESWFFENDFTGSLKLGTGSPANTFNINANVRLANHDLEAQSFTGAGDNITVGGQPLSTVIGGSSPWTIDSPSFGVNYAGFVNSPNGFYARDTDNGNALASLYSYGTTTKYGAVAVFSGGAVVAQMNGLDGFVGNGSEITDIKWENISDRPVDITTEPSLWGRDGGDNIRSTPKAVVIGQVAINKYNAGLATDITTNTSLYVEKDILAGRDVVFDDVNYWADYVFDEAYDLLPLEEVEAYIDEHNHLPNVPSEAEVKENGYSAQGVNAMLLEKIEELTLYTIELNKQLKEVKQELITIKSDQ